MSEKFFSFSFKKQLFIVLGVFTFLILLLSFSKEEIKKDNLLIISKKEVNCEKIKENIQIVLLKTTKVNNYIAINAYSNYMIANLEYYKLFCEKK